MTIFFVLSISLIHPFIRSFIASLVRRFIAWIVIHWFVGSLIQWFTVHVHCSCIHWFIDLLIHSGSCAWFLSCHFVGISTTVCSLVDAPHNFNTSWFLHLKNIFIGHVLPVVVLYVFRNFHPGTGQAIICLWLFVVFDRVFMIVCCWSVTFISLSSWIPNLRVSVLVLGCFFWPWWVCRPCFHTEDPPKTDKERGSLGRVKIGVATFWPHINWHRYVVSQILPGISWHLIE